MQEFFHFLGSTGIDRSGPSPYLALRSSTMLLPRIKMMNAPTVIKPPSVKPNQRGRMLPNPSCSATKRKLQITMVINIELIEDILPAEAVKVTITQLPDGTREIITVFSTV